MTSSFILCINAVIPTFLIMAIGFFCKKIGMVDRDIVLRFNKVTFKAFLPVMLFYNIYSSDLSYAIKPELIVYVVLGIVAEFTISILIAVFATKDRSKRGTMVQGMYRANTMVVGLPMAMELLGDVDLGPVVICLAIAVPVFNVLAVIALQSFGGEKTKPLKLVKSIITNPLIIATALAIVFSLLSIQLPTAILSTVKSISQAASPIMLFLVGAFFTFDKLSYARKELIITSAFRLMVFPSVFLALGALLGFRDVEFVALITVFASSTAISSFTMAQQLGGDADLAGNIVVITSALCPFSFFIWSYLFKILGIY